MLFTSLEFLLFLPIAVLLFWLLPVRFRLPWLLLASLGFYASFGIGNLAYLAVVAVITLSAGRILLNPDAPWRRAVFYGSLSAILGLLIVLKFYGPVADGVAWLPALDLRSPAGFSFYAFAAVALLIDRYRSPGMAPASAKQDLLFLAWFPKILAGPIERIGSFTGALAQRSPMRPAHFAFGCQLILWGLVKKVVIADNLAPFVDRTYAIPGYAVPLELIIATYFFAFQIYCDFSGYTDMARGTSQLFGIRLSENFRRPYFARSVGEFWSGRWHITLAQWFRDYLYIPLGGSRKGAWRLYLNIMLVFVISGLWHAGLGYGVGWGFVVWGALNGAWLLAERALAPLGEALRHHVKGRIAAVIGRVLASLLVFHLVLVSWVFFRAASLADGWTVLRRVWLTLPDIPGLLARYPFTAEHSFLAGLILALLAIELVLENQKLKRRLSRAPRLLRWLGWYACLFALLLLGRWQSEAFVYMQF